MLILLHVWDNFYMIPLQDLTKKKQNTRIVYQDSLPPTSPTPQAREVTENLNLYL